MLDELARERAVAIDAVARTGRRPWASRALPPGTPRWIGDLQARIRGAISVPGMPNYEAARAGGNPLYSARPAAVAFCSTEQDVRMSLLAAREQGIALRLRSGRHSSAGYSNVDDGLVIDVRPLKSVTVDPVARTATVGAGANLGELNAALDVHMLHVPAGSWPTVGVAGFMQGGGQGWTVRKYGMNCDRVAAVRVMLADGRVVRATRDENPSLLWAICGGAGGNFGVLLDVTYDLAELYLVWGFALRWPIGDAPEVLAAMQDGFMRAGDAPDELGYRSILATIEGVPSLVVLGMVDGDRESGMEVIAPLMAIGACTMTMDATDAYAVVNERLLGSEHTPDWNVDVGTHVAHRSGYVTRRLGVDGWAAVVERFRTTAAPSDFAIISPYGGRVARIPADACAFVHRDVDMNVSVYASWSGDREPGTEERAWEWANGLLDLLGPFRDGSVYQNLPERGLRDYRSAYWGSNFAKLLAIKRLADPDDVFTHPQGVSPDPAVPTEAERLPELEPEPYMARGHGLRMTMPTDRDAPTLRERLAELSDLGRVGAVLTWDQQLTMPAGGAAARDEMFVMLQRVAREKLVGDELSMLLAAGDPADPVVRVLRRDHARVSRVPARLSEEIYRAGTEGTAAWFDARAHNDFERFEPALRRNVELARAYAECFPESDHPYDALLDRYEPGATTADVAGLLRRVCDGLAPLIADLATRPDPERLAGPFPVQAQHTVALEIAAAMGFDAASFRLDGAAHPIACSSTPGDVRVAAPFEEAGLAGLFAFLHEIGHGLYERGVDPALSRTTLDVGTSIGVHESQSLLWKNVVGRSEAFWSWWLPRLREAAPALADIALDDFLRAINAVRPGLIRADADEVTYALHVLLRFELELRLVEGALDPADLPAAWGQRTSELLGIAVPDDRRGVLQDVHWAQGAFGYFPTNVIGSVFAAQLWDAASADLPWIDDDLRAGDYRALCDWLRERVHQHGRALTPAEVVAYAVGGPLDTGPLLAHLNARYRALYELR